VALPYIGGAARATSEKPGHDASGTPSLAPPDDADPKTVAEFFANPPDWLPKQLAKYREDPKLHFKPLCVAVAAVVLEDGMRWEEVREEVERELGGEHERR
jgi:hypothetical protein